jgi:hypothetical protein
MTDQGLARTLPARTLPARVGDLVPFDLLLSVAWAV